MNQILNLFNLDASHCLIQKFGSGLINNTFFITCENKKYILQKINKNVFTHPELIDFNLTLLKQFINQHHKKYFLPLPLQVSNGESLVEVDNEYYRLFSFVENSKTFITVPNKNIAYEAAKHFGKFAKIFSGLNAEQLKITLPQFHDLTLRYHQFELSLAQGNAARIHQSKQIIEALKNYKNIVDEYNSIINNTAFKKRVTHHDTKISNVLFDENNKGICVIDLDTVMPGYFISDIGDMLRTYLPFVSEEEKDVNKIILHDDYFEAIAKGYLEEMKNELSTEEKKAFVYAGKFMIYMQALRFATDYLNNDVYYGAAYPEQNFIRALNQLTLLNRFIQKEELYTSIIKKIAT